jgi:hypothetical protein
LKARRRNLGLSRRAEDRRLHRESDSAVGGHPASAPTVGVSSSSESVAWINPQVS